MAVQIIDRQELDSGNGITSLTNLANNLGDLSDLDPDTNLELELDFSNDVPNFTSIANEIDTALFLAGVETWNGLDNYVFTDEENNKYMIRFRPGNPLTASAIFTIIAIISGLAAIAIIVWIIYRVIAVVVPALNGELGTLASGGLIVLGLFAVSSIISQLGDRGG